LNANDNDIWQALGLGPQWGLKHESSTPTELNYSVLFVVDFELTDTSQGPRPEGQVATLLSNMLASISMSSNDITFVSLRQASAHPLDLKTYLKQNPFAYLVLLGDEAVQALFGGQSSVEDLHGSPQSVEFPSGPVQVVVLPALSHLIAQPSLKAKAWASLCLIRARFQPPH